MSYDEESKTKPGEIIGLKIEHTNPEDDARKLAIQLAESMEGERRQRKESVTFAEQANEWQRKAERTRILLDRIKDRDKCLVLGEPIDHLIKQVEYTDPDTGETKTRQSRMDPLKTYSAADVKKQYHIEGAKSLEFRKLSEAYIRGSEEQYQYQGELQKRLRVLNAQIDRAKE